MKYNGSEKHLKNAEKARLVAVERIIENKNGRVNEYYIDPNKCKFCDKPLIYSKKNNKFCNSSCAAKYNNCKRVVTDKTKNLIRRKLKGRKQTEEQKYKITGEKNGSWSGGKYRKEYNVNRVCDMCCMEFKAKIITNNKLSRSKYCSDDCRNKFQSENMRTKVEQGLHKGWATRNIISYPEKFFIKVLDNNNISYKHNYPVNKRELGLNDSCNYFLDFYLEGKRIDLEIDGQQHKKRKEHDNERDRLLSENGFNVYRIEWKNINTENGKSYIRNEIDKFLEYYNT